MVAPRLTLFACASSEELPYNAWSYRGLPIVTNNQAGNITLEITPESIDVYVENERYATKIRGDASVKERSWRVLRLVASREVVDTTLRPNVVGLP